MAAAIRPSCGGVKRLPLACVNRSPSIDAKTEKTRLAGVRDEHRLPPASAIKHPSQPSPCRAEESPSGQRMIGVGRSDRGRFRAGALR